MRRRVPTPPRASNWRADNIVLVPASQLPFKEEWARIARELPAREALLIVPRAETPLKRVARSLVPQFRSRGRHVTAIPPERSAIEGRVRRMNPNKITHKKTVRQASRLWGGFILDSGKKHLLNHDMKWTRQ